MSEVIMNATVYRSLCCEREPQIHGRSLCKTDHASDKLKVFPSFTWLALAHMSFPITKIKS